MRVDGNRELGRGTLHLSAYQCVNFAFGAGFVVECRGLGSV